MLEIYSRLANYLKGEKLEVQLGGEIEFYLVGAKDLSQLKSELLQKFSAELVPESGHEQHEVVIPFTSNPLKLAQEISEIKDYIYRYASTQDIKADFSSKPFAHLPGSGMHIHINYLDHNRQNIFSKKNNNESSHMLHALGGLCHNIKKHMIYFAPYEESYRRFVIGEYHTPTFISWGPNNRTAALRVIDRGNRRIEHRISGSDSNPVQVILAIILGSLHGMKKAILPPQSTYGLAFDEQYNLEPLPNNLESAIAEHSPLTELASYILGE